MKHLLFFFTLAFVFQLTVLAQNHSPYFHMGTSTDSIDELMKTVSNELQNSGFKVIGEYTPGASGNLAVLCYTSSELEKIALRFSDRGALGAALKVGFKKEGNTVKISMLNPTYLFYAYFTEGLDQHEKELLKISDAAKDAMKKIGTELTPFGGSLDKKKLQKYHYKVMMPYFKDAEKLNEFASFEEGIKIIRNNLADGKGETEKVYELVYSDKKTAVFGVGLKNTETGEDKFLPIIGDDHVAAMPYEIIVQGNTATILPGRYRIALHWPDLTMGTFMKIMSTPKDIMQTLQGLTE